MSRSRPHNPFSNGESTSGSSSNDFQRNGDRNSVIIVNSDIMILPGDQVESQTDDDSDDDDTLSTDSSYRYSPTEMNLPPPVSVNSQAQQRTQVRAYAQQQPAPLTSSSSSRQRIPVAPPRKASMEWIPTPLPTPQSRRTLALAHDNSQQRSGQQQLRTTEKQTATLPSSSPTSASYSSPLSHSSLQRTPSSSTPHRPPRPAVSPFMSELPLYSQRTKGPPKQQQQQQQQQPSSNTQVYNPHSYAAHNGDVEMQERSRNQQRPSVTRTPSVNNGTYSLPTPSPSSTVENNTNSDPTITSRGNNSDTLGRTLSTNRNGSSSGEGGGGRSRKRGEGGGDSGGLTARANNTTTTDDSQTKHRTTHNRSNSRSTNHNALNYNPSHTRSSDTRGSNKNSNNSDYIDPSTGQRQELRGDNTGGGISGFFGGLFGGGSKKANSRHSTSQQDRKKKATTGGLPASASGSKNDLIDSSQQHSLEKHSAFTQQQPSTRKKGVPGKDGQAPETDMFNFVDIMLDMPEDPTWRQVIVKLLKVMAVMCICYFSLMALYFGAEFQNVNRTKNFEVLVVDLDNSMIGSNFVNFTQHLNGIPGQLHWSAQNNKAYPDMAAIQADVLNGRFWGAVVVQPNASSNLLYAAATINADYDPTKAFAFVYEGGRDPLVVRPNIVASMYTTFLQFSKVFNPLWVKLLIASFEQQNQTISHIINAPQIVGTPVAFEEFDLHPLSSSIITSATSVAYIWIFLVAGGSTYLVANMVQPMTKNSSVAKTMLVMLLPLLMFLVALSLCYSLLLLTFGVPFLGGPTQFFSLFGGMLLLQCAVASMVLFLIYLIPVVFIPGFTITFVILNVIAVFNPVELMPVWYRWVYAMPFLNAVQIARYVLMGSYNRLLYNILILAVWILIPVSLMPFAIARQKRVARELERVEEEVGIKRSTGASRSDQRLDQKKQQHRQQHQQAITNKPVSASGATKHSNDDYDDDDDEEVVVL
ncbi:hypothetical protein BGX23_006134 [Mortierella sp. AD031]|nr:hypothetical protein BGX23_006134 [Mortierella sp. AD031]